MASLNDVGPFDVLRRKLANLLLLELGNALGMLDNEINSRVGLDDGVEDGVGRRLCVNSLRWRRHGEYVSNDTASDSA